MTLSIPAMAQTDMLKRYLDAGIAFTKMTQERAEAIVRDLVGAGEVGADQATNVVQDLVERSRENTERLLETCAPRSTPRSATSASPPGTTSSRSAPRWQTCESGSGPARPPLRRPRPVQGPRPAVAPLRTVGR
jgi:hypothetical protein